MDEYETQIQQMLAEIQDDTVATRIATGKDKLSAKVIQALLEVPRHEFVPSDLQHLAYQNIPLPIGHGQTISQPYIVALMTDLLNVSQDDIVLEVGCGSGYQSAILARLVKQVYSTEIIPELAAKAQQNLSRLGYSNIEVKVADGYDGWKEHAPFDGMIVTAVAPEVPPPLKAQLKPGGRMVIPLYSRAGMQELTLVKKTNKSNFKLIPILPVAFVPFTGRHMTYGNI